jgi:hypothetical protein
MEAEKADAFLSNFHDKISTPTRGTGAEGIWRDRFGIVVSHRPLNSMASGASKGSLLEHHQKR